MAADVLAIADALAARYASGTLTPPTGYGAVRQSTARIPNAMNLSPFVVVLLPEGEITVGGTSEIRYDFTVHFCYAKHTGDLNRDMKALLSWIGPLLWATFGQTSLGLASAELVKSALPSGFRLVVETYAGAEWYGWEIDVPVITRPAISFVA